MTSLFIYTIGYILFVSGLIYPPTEFVSAGLTIPELFSSWLGSEYDEFVQYHIKRSIVTLFVHSLLPFGYIIGLSLLGHLDAAQVFLGTEHPLWLTLSICALVGPIYALNLIVNWSRNHFSKHPIAKALGIYCNERGTWLDIAADVNREYKSLDKLQIRTNSTTKIVVTNTWIMKVSAYKLEIASQINSVLVAYNVNSYSSTPSPTESVHYVKYRIVTRQPGGKNFTIRINASDVQNLLGKITMPTRTLSSVQVPQTVTEIAVFAIKQEVAKNPTYKTTQQLEQCAVCMQATSNVKLTRNCPDIPEMDGIPACRSCNCPPIFCIDCLAKWFISSSQHKPKNVTEMKSSCPQCRSPFCLQDVSLVTSGSPSTPPAPQAPSTETQ
ncbi:E3 ubiquitin-protein ligase TM129 [Diachasma alloeum]|uniref:E3 ubiquitin-protein ligase TM129 n=1 Tax=Diachasma alloeum TaxID=454923 RepID=UPI0007381F91|nr:E3 ubiquitin-protein ligase TM129 [Diachasma alloeum]